jgi:hypothetical protein
MEKSLLRFPDRCVFINPSFAYGQLGYCAAGCSCMNGRKNEENVFFRVAVIACAQDWDNRINVHSTLIWCGIQIEYSSQMNIDTLRGFEIYVHFGRRKPFVSNRAKIFRIFLVFPFPFSLISLSFILEFFIPTHNKMAKKEITEEKAKRIKEKVRVKLKNRESSVTPKLVSGHKNSRKTPLAKEVLESEISLLMQEALGLKHGIKLGLVYIETFALPKGFSRAREMAIKLFGVLPGSIIGLTADITNDGKFHFLLPEDVLKNTLRERLNENAGGIRLWTEEMLEKRLCLAYQICVAGSTESGALKTSHRRESKKIANLLLAGNIDQVRDRLVLQKNGGDIPRPSK